MPEGVDISEHQGVWTSEQFDGFDYAILRAFNENGYRDRVIGQTWANAAGHTLRGIYGWPIPGENNFELGARLVREYPGAEAGYWADREVSSRGVASAGEVEDYLRGIESQGGKAGFYSNIGECVFSPYLDVHDWWMADYGPNNGTRHDPNEQAPRPSRPYTIHQYSSAGGLDRNWSDTLDWTDTPAPAPPPAPRPKDESMFIIKNRDTGAWTLYTALGATPNIDETFSNELAYAGVPRYDVPGSVADSVSLIHYKHGQDFAELVASKIAP